MSSPTIARRPSIFADVMADDDPLALLWMRSIVDSDVIAGKEKSLLWPLATFANECTGRIDACDAGYDETAYQLGVNVQKVRAAWKHAEALGYLVELPDGCLQLMIPAGSDTSRI